MAVDDFDAIIARAKSLVDVSTHVAAEAFPNGVALRCPTCGRVAHATSQQVARFLSIGWPMHCGTTMEIPHV